MSRAIETKRMIGLVALVVAALMVLTAALAASDAEAKKKKKRSLNKVECVNQGVLCKGTPRNDLLLGTSAFERITGGEGNDVYDGRNGEDLWFDESATSKDTYRVGSAFRASLAAGKFEPFDVLDNGGSDTVDFRPFSSDDIAKVSEPFEGHLGIRLNASPDRTGVVLILGHLENEEKGRVLPLQRPDSHRARDRGPDRTAVARTHRAARSSQSDEGGTQGAGARKPRPSFCLQLLIETRLLCRNS